VKIFCVLAASLAVLGPAAAPSRADDPKPRNLPPMDEASREWLESPGAAAFGKWLAKSLELDPKRPEWLDMFADILQGSQLGPRDGWFRRAVAQTRFEGPALAAKYDKDGDFALGRGEFPGTSEDFARLDRDGNGVIRGDDIVWPEHALAPSPGSSLYFEADADSDGRVTREELVAFFDRADSDGLGFLSLDDLKRVLPMPGAPRPSPAGAPPMRDEGPDKATLIRGLFQQEIGSLQPGPSVGETAPEFTLRKADGSGTVTLSEQLGEKPVVLVFGNITCGPFRSQAGNVEKLYRRYKDRANFVMVYVREAHPTDGWRMLSNERAEVRLDQPKSFEERVGVAQTCQRKLGFDMPFVVDTIDDAVGGMYSGMPSRLYVIDRDGKVAYKSGRGPFGFKPAEMEQALIWTLTEQAVAEREAEKAAEATAEASVGSEGGAGGTPAPQPGAEDGSEGGAGGTPAPQPAAAESAIEEVDDAADEDDAAAAPRAPVLENEEAYRRLAIVKGDDEATAPRLPIWARALAGPLPRATAAMLALDEAHRTRNPLDPVLRAAARWMVARANRSPYAMATAERDLREAGATEAAIARLRAGDLTDFDAVGRDALALAEQLTLDGSSVTDEAVAGLIEAIGPEKVVALVLLVAHGNFQDRLLLSLGVTAEPGGALAPVAVALDRQAAVEVPARVRPETADAAPPGPLRIDDPEWTGVDLNALRVELEGQKARPGRIRVPTFEEVMAKLPASAAPARPVKIQWSLVCMGYQPELASAWSANTGAFAVDARQDRVFEESLFWVVTRSIRCFY
jgi:alkylhydroperoxidase family enzyme/thiol-disulfide isomerase/thioredoxin